MSSEQIREKFLEFFSKKGHKIVASSSLIPTDKSVLLTTAGMQQFKPYYTGELNALINFGSRRTTSIQKCFRTSDIDSVGDETHVTFLEMLGNFSFGPVGSDDPTDYGINGYFKRSAIHWGYEFVTEILEIANERIKVSVFKGDDEVPFDEDSYKIWHEEMGIPKERIMLAGREDNFWGPTGDEGPCGPCSEIYVDDIEIWNLVFNEYYKEKNGSYKKLDLAGIDTGAGLERMAAVSQGVENIFEADVFQSLVSKINELAPNLDKKVIRILADHVRASIFLIADGVRPSNKEAGYILRRLLRRILAYSIKCDIHADLFSEAAEIVKNKFGKVYPEVREIKIILGVLEDEKQKFEQVVSRGIKEMERYSEISSKDAFYLYESFGLPYELIKELAPKEATKNLSKSDFDKEFEKHQELSRTASAGMFKGGLVDVSDNTIKLHTAAHLLMEALRRVLGKHVSQKGSNINAERLRLDFSHPDKLTSEQIKQVEDMVNEKISDDLAVKMEEMTLEEAKKQGAMGVFESKYGEKVKVYTIDNFSKEICGGPHVQKTSELGHFEIVKEEASSSGVRRIKAILN